MHVKLPLVIYTLRGGSSNLWDSTLTRIFTEEEQAEATAAFIIVVVASLRPAPPY